MAVHPNSLKNLTPGRELKGRKRHNLMIEPELIEFARSTGNMSEYINTLLRKAKLEDDCGLSEAQQLRSLLEQEKDKSQYLEEEIQIIQSSRDFWFQGACEDADKLFRISASIAKWQLKAKRTYNPKWHHAKILIEEIISLL